MSYQPSNKEKKLLRNTTMFIAAAYALTTQPQQYSMDIIGLATTLCYALEIEAGRQLCMYFGKEVDTGIKSKDNTKPQRDFSKIIGFSAFGLVLLTHAPNALRKFNGDIVRSGISWTCNKIEDAFDDIAHYDSRHHHRL